MPCPVAGLSVRIPIISEELRRDVRRRINIKRHKISHLKLSYSRTCLHDVDSRVKLSEAILLEMGALKELRIIARSFTIHRNDYKVDWASHHVVHSCRTEPTNNIPTQPEQIEVIDLSISPDSSISDSEVEPVIEPESHPAS